MQLCSMRSRRIFVCIPVLAYLACILFGLHSHVGVEQIHPDASHQPHHGYVATELGSAHLAEHLTDDDVDVDDSKMGAVSYSLPSTFVVSFVFLALALAAIPRQTLIPRLAERPLRPPRRSYLLPPSQAPPASA